MDGMMRKRLVDLIGQVTRERQALDAAGAALAAEALALGGAEAAAEKEAERQVLRSMAAHLDRATEEVRAAIQERDYRERHTEAVARQVAERSEVRRLEDLLAEVRVQLSDAQAAADLRATALAQAHADLEALRGAKVDGTG